MMADLDKILAEKYTTPLRKGFKLYNNDIFALNSFAKYEDAIKNFQVRDDDIWVTSFPKAGTTWTQEMVWLIVNDLDYEGAKTSLADRFPFIDLNVAMDFNAYKKEHPEFQLPENIIDSAASLNSMTQRRFIKSHLPWNYLPLQIQNQTTKAKVIQVIRNPKDVCVSYHHHSRAIEGSRSEFDEFFKLFIAGKVVYGPFFHNVMSYWNRRNLPNLLIITYEEMKKDLPSVIRKVAKFLDKEVRDDQMDRLVKHLSFDEMKKNLAVNYEPLIDVIKHCVADQYESDGIFMRSGISGSYKTQMTREMIAIMDKWIEENTAGTGLRFD